MILIGREHIASYTQQHPSSKTALALWLAIAQKVIWKSQADALACFPMSKFITQNIAHFYPSGIDGVIGAQIAFNTGIIIVLGVNEVKSSQIQGS